MCKMILIETTDVVSVKCLTFVRWIWVVELLSSRCPPGGPKKRRGSGQRLGDVYGVL